MVGLALIGGNERTACIDGAVGRRGLRPFRPFAARVHRDLSRLVSVPLR